MNLAKLDTLMDAMVDAGFSMTFLGIESPNPEALLKTKKKQNTKKGDDDFLFNAVRTIHNKGMEVTAGFILGLDGDNESVFDAQIDFIQRAGIPTAMVGLLSALKGTDLYLRLQQEGRLLEESQGNNVSINLNFVPQLKPETLIAGYKRVLRTLYDPTLSNYFERCFTLLSNLNASKHQATSIGRTEVMAILKSLKRQLFSRQGPFYFRFMMKVIWYHPRLLPEAVRLAILGYHFEKTTSQQISIHEFKVFLNKEMEGFRAWFAESKGDASAEVQFFVKDLLTRVRVQYEQIHEDFRYSVRDAMDAFQIALDSYLDQLEESASSKALG